MVQLWICLVYLRITLVQLRIRLVQPYDCGSALFSLGSILILSDHRSSGLDLLCSDRISLVQSWISLVLVVQPWNRLFQL